MTSQQENISYMKHIYNVCKVLQQQWQYYYCWCWQANDDDGDDKGDVDGNDGDVDNDDGEDDDQHVDDNEVDIKVLAQYYDYYSAVSSHFCQQ